MINKDMKTFATIILASILLIGCSVPKNPKVSWGKKCTVNGNQVVWSHLWIFDKTKGLDATKENCKLIEGK
tara:strand:+ start:764 stop:976 length:213 start_codon:yes stop_codon:yes gene_type:complete